MNRGIALAESVRGKEVPAGRKPVSAHPPEDRDHFPRTNAAVIATAKNRITVIASTPRSENTGHPMGKVPWPRMPRPAARS